MTITYRLGMLRDGAEQQTRLHNQRAVRGCIHSAGKPDKAVAEHKVQQICGCACVQTGLHPGVAHLGDGKNTYFPIIHLNIYNYRIVEE